MQKILGYVLMGLGLLVISSNLFLKNISEKTQFLSFLSETNILTIGIIGLGLIIGGYFLSQQEKFFKKQKKEVPIYEGEGKKKRIIGYKKIR